MGVPRLLAYGVLAARLALAAEISIHTVDGLDRSLPGVAVDVYCSGNDRVPIPLISDRDGIAMGPYNAASCKPISVSISKEGYESFFSGFRNRYVLSRQFTPQDVDRIIALDGDSQLSELRELLAGRSTLENSVFGGQERLRPALRTLARDPNVTRVARRLLAMIAAPEDLRFVLQLPKPPDAKAFAERWRYEVATALVNPEGEEEWSFLERCASNEFNDRWVDAGAIQTLKLTASARSQKILEDARAKNDFRAGMISRALDYIKSNPGVLAESDLESLGRRTAQALSLGTWQGNKQPRYNLTRDKALVDLTFQSGFDYLVYTATFQNVDGVWILRGVRETLQAFTVPAAPGKQ